MTKFTRFRGTTLLLGASALGLAACGGDDAAPDTAADAPKTEMSAPATPATSDTAASPMEEVEGPTTIAEATAGPSNVTIWQTGDDDTTVYMMGTIHILNPEIEWENDTFEAAWTASDVVFFEADATSMEAQQQAAALIPKYGINPPGVTFASYFTEEEQQKIDEGLKVLNLNIAMLNQIRPWLAGVQIGVSAIQKQGGAPDAGIEMVLSARAAEDGKELRYFETLEEQFQMISGVPDEAHARALLVSIDDLSQLEVYFAQLIGAWYRGDDERLAEILTESFGEAPELGQALLYDRNENWANSLQTLITEEEGTFFVAVGAAHLAGEKSVQDYLAGLGYSSSKINE